jgi:hypothetical protein
MSLRVRRRFWPEAGLALLSAVLAIVTSVRPDWIEGLTGWDPDHQNGSFEWMLTAGLAVLVLVLAALARHEWHRPRAVSYSA